MEKIILDTSVIVKWYQEEKDSHMARYLLDKIQAKTLTCIVPDITALELSNALFFNATFPAIALEETIKSFYALNLNFISLNQVVIIGAMKYMSSLSIGIYDAIFLYLAEKENCPLITADRKHHKKKYSKRIKYLDETS